MSVYTVHRPPSRMADELPDPARFIFVRDGFHFWAFLLAPLWMLWRRMWLVLASYVVVVVGLETLLKVFGASASIAILIGFLISLLVGLEAATLRRFTLRRRGWTNIGVASGEDREDAERRFFEGWIGKAGSRPTPSAVPPVALSMSGAAISRSPHSPDVIGLFPQPGAQP